MSDNRKPMGELSTPYMDFKAFNQPTEDNKESTLLKIVQGFNKRYFTLMLACSESTPFRENFEKNPDPYLTGSPKGEFTWTPDDETEEKTGNFVGYVVPESTIIRLNPTIPYTTIYFKQKGTGKNYAPGATPANPFPTAEDPDNVFLVNEERPLAQRATTFIDNAPTSNEGSEFDSGGKSSGQGFVHYEIKMGENTFIVDTHITEARFTTGYELNTELNQVSLSENDVDIVLAVPYQLLNSDLFTTIKGSKDDDVEIILSTC